jgi:hypothetical protein
MVSARLFMHDRSGVYQIVNVSRCRDLSKAKMSNDSTSLLKCYRARVALPTGATATGKSAWANSRQEEGIPQVEEDDTSIYSRAIENERLILLAELLLLGTPSIH